MNPYLRDQLAELLKSEAAPAGSHSHNQITATHGGIALIGATLMLQQPPKPSRPAPQPAPKPAPLLGFTRISAAIGLAIWLAVAIAFVFWHYDPTGAPLVQQMLFGGWPLSLEQLLVSFAGAFTAGMVGSALLQYHFPGL